MRAFPAMFCFVFILSKWKTELIHIAVSSSQQLLCYWRLKTGTTKGGTPKGISRNVNKRAHNWLRMHYEKCIQSGSFQGPVHCCLTCPIRLISPAQNVRTKEFRTFFFYDNNTQHQIHFAISARLLDQHFISSRIFAFQKIADIIFIRN